MLEVEGRTLSPASVRESFCWGRSALATHLWVMDYVHTVLWEAGAEDDKIKREMRLSPKDRPDLIYLDPPEQIIVVECKVTAGAPSYEQLLRYDRVAKAVWPECTVVAVLAACEFKHAVVPPGLITLVVPTPHGHDLDWERASRRKAGY